MLKPAPAFAGLDDLVDLAHRDGIDMRPTLLRVLTDLYLQRPTHTPDDERYYTELALRLLDAVDVTQRAALAARLAAYPAAPRDVILRLARDEIEVAETVLRLSPCLTAIDLGALAQECGQGHASIIAARRAAPAPTPAPAVIEPAVEREAVRAEAVELSELFFAAGPYERRLILINLDYALIAPVEPAFVMQRAEAWRLESAALQHNGEAMVRELERMFDISRALARRMIEDESGEPIVVAAKAMELPSDLLQRMLLFINPRIGQSVDRVFELAALYGEISTVAARRLLALWRDADTEDRRPIQHEPVAWRTAAENARRALAEVPHRPELRHEPRWRGFGNDR
jgi:hypothetical protein